MERVRRLLNFVRLILWIKELAGFEGVSFVS